MSSTSEPRWLAGSRASPPTLSIRARRSAMARAFEPGTVLARIDGALFQARLDQARGRVTKAEADIEQAQAKLRQADRELDRCRKLMVRKTIAAQEYDTTLANYESARATLAVNQGALAVARADLEEATVNLGYTTIRSPVKGIVLDRRINVGQVVVASLNAPSLFLIAKDLSRLEIWSSVNETDIGSIHEGQPVTFTVSALPRDTFEGKVSQIRLNASMTQNVVTYTVVVAVDNSAGRLLPYLTARLQFEVERRKGVLLVPNAALRWQPLVRDVVPEAREEYALAQRRPPAVVRGTRADSQPLRRRTKRPSLGAAGRLRKADQGARWPFRRSCHRGQRRRPGRRSGNCRRREPHRIRLRCPVNLATYLERASQER